MDVLEGRCNSIYIVCNVCRLNALTFLTRLEYDYYHPETDATDDFYVFQTAYQNGTYYIIELPARDYSIAETLARELNFKFIAGKPHTPGGERFNLKSDACFTLEYISPRDGDEKDYAAARSAELTSARLYAASASAPSLPGVR